MSFIENHFSELSGTVTVTPARPRRREANVQQRVAVIEALGRSVGPERAERIERAVASSGGRGLSPTDRAAYIKAENAVEGEDETVSRVDDSGSELFATPNDPRRLMATDRRGQRHSAGAPGAVGLAWQRGKPHPGDFQHGFRRARRPTELRPGRSTCAPHT